MLGLRDTRGVGIVEILIFMGVIAVVFTVTLNFMHQNFAHRAMLRKNYLTKKSFGGAETIMIDQRQCRCNFFNNGFQLTFARDVAPATRIEIDRLKSYEDVDGCTDRNNDIVLSETDDALANRSNLAKAIEVSDFQVVIPQMLYRARVYISPMFGKPVNFPVLFSGRTVGNNFNMEICGVDRAS